MCKEEEAAPGSPTPQPDGAVAVDEALNDDSADSTFGDETNSYTTSLDSAVTSYKSINGRRYHAYKEGSYIYPNDEGEKDRLDIVHKMCELVMDGKLYLSPIDNPKHVLDIGTGTGIWAMEMGDRHPNADITGNDLSPIQPRWVPANVQFEVDDAEADWTYSRPFDLIHSRTMAGSIRDFPRLIKQAYDNLVPGGYLEMIDYDGHYTSPDGSLTEDSDMAKVNRMFMETAAKNGLEASPGPLLAGWMKDAGFQDVTETKRVLPFGTWPADKKLKEVGAWNYVMLDEGLEGLVNYLFITLLGMTPEEVAVTCAKIRSQLRDKRIHIYHYLHIVYGRKPEKPNTEKDD